jgi:EmrB/QacA subfamily drug resistance transporter
LEETKWYKQRWIAMGFLALSLLVISLDNTVLNLALPSIAKDLGSSASALQWVVDGYLLVFAGMLLTMGSIGDRVGRKRVLQIGLAIFGTFSLAAALSRSTGTLIGMRSIMGLGAAAIMPTTLSIITATFRDNKERAQAIAIWAATFALGSGIGPLVGGFLLEHFSWSSVFFINVPVSIMALIGGFFFIHDSKDEHPRRIDAPGFVLSIAGLFALVYAIIQAGSNGWGATNVLWAFAAAAVLLTAFALWELRSAYPVLPLKFFENMSFTGANLALTLVSFALMGAFFFLGQSLQSVMGFTPLQSGVRLLPIAFFAFAASILSARIAARLGTKITVSLGILLAAAGFLYFSQTMTATSTYGQMAVGMSIVSIGIGMTLSPATNSVMGSVPVNRAGVGSAMNDTTRQVGGALGVAVLGSLLNSTYISQVDAVKWPVQLSSQMTAAIRNSIQEAHMVAQGVPNAGLSSMIISKSNEAFAAGAVHATLVGAIVLACAAVLTFFILPAKVRPYQESIPAGAATDPVTEAPDDLPVQK